MHPLRIIIIAVLLCLILYIRYRSRQNGILLTIPNLILLFIIISIFPAKVKLILVICVLFLFRINLFMYIHLFTVCYRAYHGQYAKISDVKIRYDATQIFKYNFNFIHNFDDLPSYPTMFVSNYIYNRLEHAACIIIPRKIAVVMGHAIIDMSKLDKVICNIILKPRESGGSYEIVKKQVKEKYSKDLNIFAYVTKMCHYKVGTIGRVRKGMFSIAKELGITVTPVAIDYIHNVGGVVVPQNFRIIVGKTFPVNDVNDACKQTRKFLIGQYSHFIKNKFKR